MEITDIKIRKLFDDGPMKAVVSVTFDDQLAVHDIKVIYAKDKFFIVMPSRKNPDNSYRDIVHPIKTDDTKTKAVKENTLLIMIGFLSENSPVNDTRLRQALHFMRTLIDFLPDFRIR